MNRFLRLELRRYRGHVFAVAATAGGVLLGALYLFSFVGRVEGEEMNGALLSDYATVTALALTVALCAITIHGAALYSKMIIFDYDGDRRVLLYAYPGGRGPFFTAKNIAFSLVLGLAAMAGLACATALYLLMEAVVPVVRDSSSEPWLPIFLGTVLNVGVLAVALSLVAGTIGLRMRSQVVAVVAALILVALLANGATAVLLGSALIAPLVTIVALLLALVLLGGSVRRIEKDEVF